MNYNIMETIAGEWYKATFTDDRHIKGFNWDELIEFGLFIYDKAKGGKTVDGL